MKDIGENPAHQELEIFSD
jgi:hypothetical protein